MSTDNRRWAEARPTTPVIRCVDIAFGYPRSDFRLAVPSLAVAAGEKVALVGPSGSGKTTLLDLIAGVRTPGRGRIVVDDAVVSELSDTKRRAFRLANVGFVFQTFELFGHLTVRENVLFPAAVSGRLRRERAAFDSELHRLAEAVGLSGRLDRRVERLSRGEQQRVALCRALVHRPPVLLADEPTGNLDPGNKATAMRLLVDAAADRGSTLLVATHDESLLPLFDRVLDLRELGRPA
ncbi:MAG TPA: ABC transporter ATP-binding protein [Planctomycetaceae bacterium]